MKKLSIKVVAILIFAFLFLGCTVFAQPPQPLTVTEDLTQTWEEKEDREVLFEARTILENMTNVNNEGLIRLQEMEDQGKLDTVPIDLQKAIRRWKNIYRDAKTAFEADQELVDIYQWRP